MNLNRRRLLTTSAVVAGSALIGGGLILRRKKRAGSSGGLRIACIGIGGKANLLAVPRLAAAARRFQVDLLHSHLSTASWWCGWLEQFGGPPSIGHVHGFNAPTPTAIELP